MFARDDRLSWDMDVKDDYHTYAEITVAIYPYILAATQVVGQRACVRAYVRGQGTFRPHYVLSNRLGRSVTCAFGSIGHEKKKSPSLRNYWR